MDTYFKKVYLNKLQNEFTLFAHPIINNYIQYIEQSVYDI